MKKVPLLYYHLLDLADAMESHGLAAHAAAPLAMCELVARICLAPPETIPSPKPQPKVDDSANSKAAGAKGKGGKGKNASPKGGGTTDGKEDENQVGEGRGPGTEQGDTSPAIALACLRRSRLLLKLGPT